MAHRQLRVVDCHCAGADNDRIGERAQPMQVRQHTGPTHKPRVAGAGCDAAVQALAQLADHPGTGVGLAIEQGLEQFKKRSCRSVRCAFEPPAIGVGAAHRAILGRQHLRAGPARRSDGQTSGPHDVDARPRFR